jgi:Spy/CpxP family protein refolding chaperone
MKKKLIAGILALALVATAFAVVAAQSNSSGPRPGGPGEMSQLTDEERDAIQQQLQEYEQELLAQHGITLTDEQMDALQQAMQEQMRESHQNQFGPYNCTLTDEEREAIKEQMESQRVERQQKMQALLAQYGINLTDEEWQGIQAQLQEHRQELLAAYGISCPAHRQNGWMGRGCRDFGEDRASARARQSYRQNLRI